MIRNVRPSNRRLAALAVVGSMAIAVALTGNAVAAPAARAASGSTTATTLAQAAAAKGRVFGAAVANNHLAEPDYANTFDSEFNGLTPENEMKWETTEPARGSFNFGPADAVVSHAKGLGFKVRGHTLVWHSQLPSWVSEVTSGDELMTVMQDHIAGEAGHYRGEIQYWDVVNEAFEEDGTRRQTIFQQRIGDRYLEAAFRAARAADPGAKLCYNDFNIDGRNAKSDAVFAMVKDFKARGVPIDCVGFQSHLIVKQLPSDYQANLQRFADLGIDVNVTELDIRMPTPASDANLARQASDFRKVIASCLAVKRCTSMTVWGVTDKYSWVPNTFPGEGAPLLFDDNYAKKRAYTATLRALGG